MPAVQSDSLFIPEAEYLAGELSSDVRHEYVAGQVFAMAGASLRHNDIALNLAFALRGGAQGTPCRVNVSDVKVHVRQSKAYYYPDVVVSCGAEDAEAHSLQNPCLIAEVTSGSTEWRDFTEKALAYQKLESLQAYLIIAQDTMQVTLYFRDGDGGWQVSRFDEPEQSLALVCPEMVLDLQAIYAGITF
ncbi:MAG: Uma2 family endonuclease [Thiolinea sp.]